MDNRDRRQFSSNLVGRFITCNPWYLVSTMLVLAGVALVVRGDKFISSYVMEVGFNFGSIQLYELCLVIAAVILVKVHVRYDALLLVIIEVVFWLIPFVLLNCVLFSGQYEEAAAPGNTPSLWRLTGLFVGLSVGIWGFRYWILRKAYSRLDIGSDFLFRSAPIFIINLAIPFVFRFAFDLEDMGMKEGLGVILSWMVCVVAPMLALLPNVRPLSTGKWPRQLERQPWVQFFALVTLSVMTVFHLIWIDFLYDLAMGFLLLLPFIWVLMWTLWVRVNDYSPKNAAGVRYWLLFAPALITPCLLSPGHGYLAVFPVAVNGVIYAYLYVRRRYTAMAGRLAVLSGISLTVYMSAGLVTMGSQVPQFMPTFVAVLILGSVVALTVHNPIGAVFGAVGVVGLILKLASSPEQVWAPAVSVGLGFFLLHSCFWNRRHEYWVTVRLAATVVMLMMGVLLCGGTWLGLQIHVTIMVVVIASWWAVVLVFQRDDLRLSLKVIQLGPLVLLVKAVRELVKLEAYGPVVMIGAFSVFAFGVWVSLRKRRKPADRMRGVAGGKRGLSN